jgi:hypothetical protein
MTKRRLDAYAPNPSSQVGCPPQDVVTQRGDPSSPPPHPPCPSPPGPSPAPLTKMGGHIDKRHGIHLVGDRVVAFVARGSKVDI